MYPPHPVLLAGCNRSDVKQGKEMRCNMRQVNAFKRVHTLLDKASHNTIIKRETTTATSVFFFNEKWRDTINYKSLQITQLLKLWNSPLSNIYIYCKLFDHISMTQKTSSFSYYFHFAQRILYLHPKVFVTSIYHAPRTKQTKQTVVTYLYKSVNLFSSSIFRK